MALQISPVIATGGSSSSGSTIPANIPLSTIVYSQSSVGFNQYQYSTGDIGGTSGITIFTGSYRFWLPSGSKIKVVGAIKGSVGASFSVEIGFQVLVGLRPAGYSAIQNVSFTSVDGTDPAPKTSSTYTLGADDWILPYAKYSSGIATFSEEIFCQIMTAS